MSELNILIEGIESKLETLVQKITFLEQEKKAVEERLSLEINKKNELKDALTELTNRHNSLRHINALLGSEEHKRETKLKINSLIREIDHCISQLSK